MNFQEASISSIRFDPFEKIGKEWMLVSALDNNHSPLPYNTMTASWGGVGVLWGKNVFFCFIRDSRYTKEFVDNSDIISLSFFDESKRAALSLCGKKSGRDGDKIAEAKLTPVIVDGALAFEEAKLVIIGKKLFAGKLAPDDFCDKSIINDCYKNGDFHTMYVCEITKVLQK